MPDSKLSLNRLPKPMLLGIALFSVLAIGWIRRLTGPEFALSLLYLVPIVSVTWTAGSLWGIAMALISTASWLLADLSMLGRFSHAAIPLLNEAFRLMVFLFIVFIIARHRAILDRHQELAMLDPLTGAANRRAFFRLAGTELDRCRRYNHPFSIMVIDIDDFKQINDTLGHHAGDQLLSTVVETINTHVRAIDIVARFGGDEFVVLLVRTDEVTAGPVTRKLQNQLLATMDSNRWPVTFSIGVATYRSVPETLEETLRAADALMYQVKHGGKNDIRHAILETKETV